MKSLKTYIIPVFIVMSGICANALNFEQERALKSNYVQSLHDTVVLQDNYRAKVGLINYRVKYIAAGGFGKVYEIVVTPPADAPIGEFSVIAKVMVKIPKGDFANENIQKMIINAKLLSKSQYFIGFLGLINNRLSNSTASEGINEVHPVVLLEKGLDDLNKIFVESGIPRLRIIVGDARDYIKLTGQTSKEYSVPKLLKDMVEGIAFMHKNNLAHFDLKPQNMLMGVDSIVKIIDTDDAVEVRNPTREYPGGSFSTPFVSPERARAMLGQKQISETIDWKKSDIYALGVSMLLIITGYSPTKMLYWGLSCFKNPQQNLTEDQTKASDFTCTNETRDLLSRIAKGNFSSMLEKNPLLYSDEFKPLYKLIIKMLANDPAKRLSIEEVKAELNKIYP